MVIRRLKVSSIDQNYFIDCFSSIIFSRLYQIGTFPAAIRADSLQLTDQYWDLLDSIEQVVEYISNHDGVTVICQYNYSMTNSQSIVCGNTNTKNSKTLNPDSQVDSDTICYHQSYIQPTDISLLNPRFESITALNELKFDVSSLDLAQRVFIDDLKSKSFVRLLANVGAWIYVNFYNIVIYY